MAARRGLLAAEHTLLVADHDRGRVRCADWLLPPGSQNALNQLVNEAHPTDRHLDGSPQPCETQDMILPCSAPSN